MKIIFMGTPDFAVPTLDALVEARHAVVAVYSQPPRAAGRGKRLTLSPVQARAQELGLTVRTPETLRDKDVQADFAALEADVAVVAAYGLILPKAVLEAPHLGCLNVHGSILPRWRGAAPVQRAILAGDTETGVTIMEMEKGLDTGAMRLVERTPIATKTAGELTAELATMGAAMMVRVLADPDAFPPVAQPDDGVTYAHKIDKAEARIDWSQGAVQVERQVRAFNPFPGAFFVHRGERFRVHAVDLVEGAGAPGTVLDDRLTIACGQGAIRPTLIQRAGKAAMSVAELLRGYAIPKGAPLG